MSELWLVVFMMFNPDGSLFDLGVLRASSEENCRSTVAEWRKDEEQDPTPRAYGRVEFYCTLAGELKEPKQ